MQKVMVKRCITALLICDLAALLGLYFTSHQELLLERYKHVTIELKTLTV